jgi:hypothetical protein
MLTDKMVDKHFPSTEANRLMAWSLISHGIAKADAIGRMNLASPEG